MAKFKHTAHRELWDWLAGHPDKSKSDWPGWEDNGGKYKSVDSNCFACKYAEIAGCYDCPLVWPDNSAFEEKYYIEIECYPLFKHWNNETDLQKRSKLAAQIRDLPVRKGVECI